MKPKMHKKMKMVMKKKKNLKQIQKENKIKKKMLQQGIIVLDSLS